MQRFLGATVMLALELVVAFHAGFADMNPHRHRHRHLVNRAVFALRAKRCDCACKDGMDNRIHGALPHGALPSVLSLNLYLAGSKRSSHSPNILRAARSSAGPCLSVSARKLGTSVPLCATSPGYATSQLSNRSTRTSGWHCRPRT